MVSFADLCCVTEEVGGASNNLGGVVPCGAEGWVGVHV